MCFWLIVSFHPLIEKDQLVACLFVYLYDYVDLISNVSAFIMHYTFTRDRSLVNHALTILLNSLQELDSKRNIICDAIL